MGGRPLRFLLPRSTAPAEPGSPFHPPISPLQAVRDDSYGTIALVAAGADLAPEIKRARQKM